jgi:hypothetical protein
MTYPTNTTYHLENQWDHNDHGNAERIEPHHVNHVYDLEDGDQDPKDNRCSEESEAADNALTRRGMGPSRRRAFQNPEDRLQTAQTRKDKACLRCRMQKIRVFNKPFVIIPQVTNRNSSAIQTLQIQGESV